MPISRGQAEFNFISSLLDEQESLRKRQNKIRRREERKARRSGTGSLLGSLLGAILAPPTGGLSIGIGAGLGSRVGSELGERSVRGSSEIDPNEFLFGQSDIRQRNVEQRRADKEFGQGQFMDAITKGITAGIFAPEIGRAKDVGRSFFEGSKRFGSLRDATKFIGSGELPIGLQKSQDLLGSQVSSFGLNPQQTKFGAGFQPNVASPIQDTSFLGSGATTTQVPPQGALGGGQDILSLFKNKTPDEITELLEQPRGARRVFDNDHEALMRMLDEILR